MQIVKGHRFYPVQAYQDLRDMIQTSGKQYGQAVAFRFRKDPASEPETRTYAQFIENYRQLGTSLVARGFRGKKIAVIGENSYSWCITHTAVLNGVGISVPLDRLLPAAEILALLERGGVSAIFYDAAFHDVCLEANRSLNGQIELFCCMRPDRLKPSAASIFESAGETDPDRKQASFVRYDDLLSEGRTMLEQGDQTYDDLTIDGDALASLLFTSGTTSTSKAVMLSHRNICADIEGLAGILKLKPGTRMLSILPLHHTFENTCGLYTALAFGCEIVICDGLRYIQKNLQEYHIDMIIGVPAVFENFYRKVQDTLKKTGKDKLVSRMIPLTNALRKAGIDVRRRIYHQILDAFGGRLSLGICGAAPIDGQIIAFFDSVGFRILQGYGLTETSPVAAGCNDRDFKPGTVGFPISGVEIAIDSDGPGEPGEILVRGPIVMKGYYNDPVATAEVIDQDGWFHTGDVGVLDPKDQFLSITGRLKSMIVLKNGKKVFPEEIEFLINQNACIKESLVWGEEDPNGDVFVNAKLVLDRDCIQQKGVEVTDEGELKRLLDTVIGEINRHLPSFKSIRHYGYSFQEMVKTTTLKIKRPIEIAALRSFMEQSKLRWREITGRNLDNLTANQAMPDHDPSDRPTDSST